MKGVEILTTKEVVSNYIFNSSAFYIAFGVAFIILLVIGVLLSITTNDYSNVLIGLVLGVIFGIIFGFLFGNINAIPAEYEIQYEVIISDEVTMSEFAEKYKIINQKDKIYTVVEIE